jgi:hypothetical protein
MSFDDLFREDWPSDLHALSRREVRRGRDKLSYVQLRLPQVAEAFAHLGFPAYFRVQLSWAKLIGDVNQSAGAKGRRAEAELIADLVKPHSPRDLALRGICHTSARGPLHD